MRSVFVCLWLILTGCPSDRNNEAASDGTDTASPGETDSCVPGHSMACTCANGSAGARVCVEGAYTTCQCAPDGETGGDETQGSGAVTTTEDSSTGPDGGASTGPDGSTTGGAVAMQDDFERSELGPNWAVIFPPPPNDDQVQIIDDSDLGMGPGPQGFFLVNWRGSEFTPDQFCEATIPEDVTDGWAHQVYVRWREDDGARYGFGYNNDPGQTQFGNWYFKYDGVPSAETRVFATADAGGVTPQPGDTIRVEVEGYTLRGYFNGDLVLEATDEDPSKIAAGEVGLAARWATGNQSTDVSAKVWESWSGGDL